MKVKIVKEVKRRDGLWRFACGDVLITDRKVMDSSDIFDTASQEGEEEYEEELSAAEVPTSWPIKHWKWRWIPWDPLAMNDAPASGLN